MGIICDRGIMKWQATLMLPEHKALNERLGEGDNFLNKKPVLDEYQVEELDNNIHYALEYHLPIRFRLHNEGNPHDLSGYCVYIHPVTKELRIQKKDSSLEYIQFDEITGVIVEDQVTPLKKNIKL
ncbi:YolD-like family protein [Peribacillus simplex]|uniref:YolD-like family protein n=2 Tax=Peribacillus TaxID=2675229 RepID=A0AA90SY52_9BACI|nr:MULTISPECIES: YolD-like family protein [Peribacillus]MDP1421058.1 YolD-like family protein [Peribacillus simplex]MDP1453825.1 YolD-like family protein [Peribacillus frigoritolerans]